MTIRYVLTLCAMAILSGSQAQYFGTVWKGRVGDPGPGRTWDVELILEKSGDSVKGLSYYQGAYYRNLRIPVKGFLDPSDNSLTWWHDSAFGTDDEGKPALDPMPPGIRYRLGYGVGKDNTENLEGKVAMSIWSGEKWERDVRFERAQGSTLEKVAMDLRPTPTKPASVPVTASAARKPAAKSRPPVPSKSAGTAVRTEKDKPVARPTGVSKPPPPTVKAAEKPAAAVDAPSKPVAGKTEVPPRKDTAAAPRNVPKTSTAKKSDPTSVPKVSPKRDTAAAPRNIPKTSTAKKADPTSVPKVPPAKPKTSAPGETAVKTGPAQTRTGTSAPGPSAERQKPGKVVVKTEPKKTPPPVASVPPAETRRESVMPSETPSALLRLTPLRSRERVLVEEVVVHGDTLWLNLYDPAEVDGDTVTVYLGDTPLATRVGLTLQPHTIGIPVVSLPDNVDLTMYAENLGAIPPNTALLVLYVAGERKEVRLESSERVSATVRFLKPEPMRR